MEFVIGVLVVVALVFVIVYLYPFTGVRKGIAKPCNILK